MKLFRTLENFFESLIYSLLGSRFRSALQPVEIAKKLFHEMNGHRKISVSTIYVPNEYKVQVSSDDWQEISPLARAFAEEVASYLVEKAREKNFTMVSYPKVSFSVDESLSRGQMKTSSSFVEADEGTTVFPRPQPEREMEDTLVFPKVKGRQISEALSETWCLVVKSGPDEEKVFSLSPTGVTIGRSETNDIFLQDPRTSRRHARIERVNDSYFLVDLDSLNGSFVNGEKIRRKKIEPGDLIKLGESVLEVRVSSDCQ